MLNEDTSTRHFLSRSQALIRECRELPIVGSSQSLEDDKELFTSSVMDKFEALLTLIIDSVLSKEGSSCEIQRLAPDFRSLIQSLFGFFLRNASLFEDKHVNTFESFLKFYFIRTNYKYIRHFLGFLNQQLRPFLLGDHRVSAPRLQIEQTRFAALLRCFCILTSFNIFSESKHHFITMLDFGGFFVENKFLNSIDPNNKSYLGNQNLFLNLHLKNDFSVLLQFFPCSRAPVGRHPL